jgi:hypothetical protein
MRCRCFQIPVERYAQILESAKRGGPGLRCKPKRVSYLRSLITAAETRPSSYGRVERERHTSVQWPPFHHPESMRTYFVDPGRNVCQPSRQSRIYLELIGSFSRRITHLGQQYQDNSIKTRPIAPIKSEHKTKSINGPKTAHHPSFSSIARHINQTVDHLGEK